MEFISLKCDTCDNPLIRKRSLYNYHSRKGRKYWFCSRKCKANFPLFKIRTELHKRKISNALKGRKTGIIPIHAFKKNHTINNGRITSLETRKKLSDAIKGEKIIIGKVENLH